MNTELKDYGSKYIKYKKKYLILNNNNLETEINFFCIDVDRYQLDSDEKTTIINRLDADNRFIKYISNPNKYYIKIRIIKSTFIYDNENVFQREIISENDTNFINSCQLDNPENPSEKNPGKPSKEFNNKYTFVYYEPIYNSIWIIIINKEVIERNNMTSDKTDISNETYENVCRQLNNNNIAIGKIFRKKIVNIFTPNQLPYYVWNPIRKKDNSDILTTKSRKFITISL